MNQFRLPYHLIVAQGAFDRIADSLGAEFTSLTTKKVIFVTEENLQKIFADRIDRILRDFPLHEIYFIKEASYDQAAALAKYITMNDIACVIGFGGGTVLDLAKFAAFVSKTRLISLATTLSNDSLSSPVAVLGTEGKARKTFRCTIPDAILVDTDVIRSAPKRQLLAGIGDTVAKYTALHDWKLAESAGREKVDDFAYMISKVAFSSICNHERGDVEDPDFIKDLTRALVLGGLAMEIAGSSRPSSGSEHLFCHALEENFSEEVSIPHGIAVAMGSYAAVLFQNRNLPKMTRVLKKYQIPVRPSDWNLKEETFVAAWQQASATRSDRYTVLNETDLSDTRLSEIYQRMEEVF